MSRKVKIILTPSKNTIKLLTFIDENIATIRRMGVTIQFEMIRKSEMDDTMIQTLQKKGVTRLPAMIVPGGRKYIGVKDIIKELSTNVKAHRVTERVSAPSSNINEFYENELFVIKDGKKVGRTDADEVEGSHADIERRMAAAQAAGPAHRREDAQARDPPREPLGMGENTIGDNITSLEDRVHNFMLADRSEPW